MKAYGIAIGAWVLLSGSFAIAQVPDVKSTDRPPALDKAPGVVTDKTPQRAFLDGEKKIAFEMRKKPWNEVIEWLVDHTGLRYIGTQAAPTGTFNFISPKGALYTFPQVIDIINDGLLQHQFALIRRDESFWIVSADVQLDPNNVARVAIKDLDKRGKTEIVQINVQLKVMNADEYAPEIKKQMGPFGQVIPLTAGNQLLLVDTAGNLLHLMNTINGVEKSEEGEAETYKHKCIYVKASEAERVIRAFLGDPLTVYKTIQGAQAGGNAGGAPANFGPGGFGGGGPGGGFPGGGFRGGDGGGGKGAAAPRVNVHYVTSDERSNTVYVNARPNKIAQVKSLMTTLDQPQPKELTPLLQTYYISAGNAEAMVKMLQDIPEFRPSNSLKMQAISGTQIMVWGAPDTQMEIARYLQPAKTPATVTETIPLAVLESPKVAETLKAMLGETKGGAPYIEGDPSRNVVIVRGSSEQVRDVKMIIQSLGENPAALGSMRIISLEKGSAATLADALQRLMPQMRDTNVKVILPGNDNTFSPLAPVPKPAPAPEPKKVDKLSPISFNQDPQLVDPAAEKDPKLPKGNGKTLTITAFGNKLILLSDDPASLSLAQELIRLMTKTEAGEGDFEVIRLKNANATDIARIVDEAFNGPKQGAGGQGGRGGQQGGFNPIAALTGGIGGMLQSAIGGSPAQRTERVRVVADPATNSLLIRATPLDLLTIRNILRDALDSGVTDSNAVAKTWMIGPLKHANAVDVAGVIQSVYRDNINANAQQMRVGGQPGFGFPFGGQQQMQQRPDSQKMALSVGIDERSNSLIISCAKPLHDDIQKLIEMLETSAADTKQMIRVVSIKGVDPLLIDQAVEAIQGRSVTAARRPMTTTGGGFNAGGGGNFGGQGFGPGIGAGFGAGGGGIGGGLLIGPGGGGFGVVPGQFGGGVPGGFGGGGGVIRPGGGGGGFQGGGGGGGGPRRPSSYRGPDFFDSSVMDDHQTPVLFDPASSVGSNGIAQASYQEPADPKDKKADPSKVPELPKPEFGKGDISGRNDDIIAPRLPVQLEPLQDLGVMVIRANNPADLKATLDLIDLIVSKGKTTQIEIELVPLEKADPTSVVNSLNILLNRINFGANATSPVTGGIRSAATVAPTQTAPGLGVLGGVGQQPGGVTATSIQNVPANSSVVLIPLPRLSSILVATFKSRMDDIKKEIRRLDQDFAPGARATPFQLKHQSASRVAGLITSFYATRFPQESQGQNQVRVTFDENSNTVFVQAAPADLDEIRGLIERIDNTFSKAVNELKVVTMRNALAEDMAIIVTRAISEGLASANPNAGGLPGIGGPQGGIFGGAGGGGGAGGLFGGAAGAAGQAGQANQNTTNGTTRATKVSALRLITNKKLDGKAVESGLLDDIRITADPRTNNLIISAPAATMELVLALVRELDIIPNARSEVNVFQLRRADAYQVALMLQQLFQGTGATRATNGNVAPGGAGGGGGALGGVGGGFGAAGAQGGGATGRPALMLSLAGIGPDGAPLIDLRVTIDERTNSIIAAGSRSDLAIIEALIARLEDADIQFRRNEAFRLRNAQAADVAAALSDFVTKTMAVWRGGNQQTPFQEVQRDVVVVAEPISNTLLISATPQYMDDVLRMISQLDLMPPQVAVQVLIAEVDMNTSNEFGAEIGFQSPVFFRRGLSTDGTTATPGFPFNTTVLGNNPQQAPGVVGYQGISNLGVGRSSARNNVGGFVFSASSNSVNILVRALQTQGRLDILSRPQLMTLDNQTAIINIGQDVPVLSSSSVTGTGVVTQNIDRKTIGVIMQVTPRITPEGRVLMRVIPEISSIANQAFPLGNGTTSTSFNLQHLETTISAFDGETVMLGGLIATRDEKNENKVPVLGDMPYLGSMFRYRTQYKTKTELLIIMTPHIVRNKADGERVLAEEARKMDWALGNVLKAVGPNALDFPTQSGGNVPPGGIFPPQPSLLDEGPLPRPAPGQMPPQPKNTMPMPPASSAAPTPMPLPSGPQTTPTSAPISAVPASSDANAPVFPARVPNGVPVQRLTPTSAIVPGEQSPPPARRTTSVSLIPNYTRGTTPVTQLIPNTSPTTEGTR